MYLLIILLFYFAIEALICVLWLVFVSHQRYKMEYTLDTVINYIQQYFCIFCSFFHLQFDGEKNITKKVVQKDYEKIKTYTKKAQKKLSKFHEKYIKKLMLNYNLWTILTHKVESSMAGLVKLYFLFGLFGEMHSHVVSVFQGSLIFKWSFFSLIFGWSPPSICRKQI